MYKRGEGSDRILLGIYVDDLIITSSSESGIITFKEEMKETFRMSDLGKLSFYLGLEVLQSETGITVTQSAYAQRILEKNGMSDCNPARRPLRTDSSSPWTARPSPWTPLSSRALSAA
jgi:hypothetical protein